jgi:hypothetical protein
MLEVAPSKRQVNIDLKIIKVPSFGSIVLLCLLFHFFMLIIVIIIVLLLCISPSGTLQVVSELFPLHIFRIFIFQDRDVFQHL